MKSIKFLGMMLFLGLAVISCKPEATNGDASRESLKQADATTNPTLGLNSNNANANATKPAEVVPVGPLTSIEFDNLTHDYGEIMEGDKVTHMYKFTNTGNEPLVISNAKGSCGCTVPSWPREPIPVGESAEIKVQFDSKGKGKVGGQPQSKRVTLTANTDPANTYLTIKGKVNKEETAEVKTPAS